MSLWCRRPMTATVFAQRLARCANWDPATRLSQPLVTARWKATRNTLPGIRGYPHIVPTALGCPTDSFGVFWGVGMMGFEKGKLMMSEAGPSHLPPTLNPLHDSSSRISLSYRRFILSIVSSARSASENRRFGFWVRSRSVARAALPDSPIPKFSRCSQV